MTAYDHFLTTDRISTEIDSRVTRRAVMRGLGGAGLAMAGLALAGRSAERVSADHAEPPMGTEDVITAYLYAMNAHDLEGILRLYAEDVLLVALPTPDGSAGISQGKEQCRLWYERSIASGDQIELIGRSLQIRDERATFTVMMTSTPWIELGIEQLEATVEAVVVDGLMQTHIVMLSPGGVRVLLAAQGVTTQAFQSHSARFPSER